VDKAIIINGVDIIYDMKPESKIEHYRDLALADSNNTGRAFGDWEIHDDEGNLIKPETLVDHIESDRLFLNLSIGFGGCQTFKMDSLSMIDNEML